MRDRCVLAKAENPHPMPSVLISSDAMTAGQAGRDVKCDLAGELAESRNLAPARTVQHTRCSELASTAATDQRPAGLADTSGEAPLDHRAAATFGHAAVMPQFRIRPTAHGCLT